MDRKKTTSVFDGFCLTACENIDIVTQYLANNRIFGDVLVDFSCKIYLPVNTRVKKSSFDIFLIISMDLKYPRL